MTDRRALAALVLVHLAIVAIVEPRGDFPLNDDWAFAHSVQWLLEEHRMRLSQWVAMNLVPQTLAGGAVTAMFGFSFETLRHLTQAVALATMVLLYAWFRVVRLEPMSALVATLAVVAFPPWGQLANSFMTDLYGLSLGIGAAILFVRAIETSSARVLSFATAVAIVGVLHRQVVLVVPFAYMASVLWTRRPIIFRAAILAIAPLALCLAAEALFQVYLVVGPGLPEGQRVAHGRLLPFVLKGLTNQEGILAWQLSNLASISGLIGLLCAGWLAWWGPAGATRAQRIFVLIGGVVIAGASFALDWYLPYRTGQVIDRAGIGPLLLYDAHRGFAPIDRAPGIFWPALSLIASFAIAALILTLWRAIASLRRGGDPILVFCVAAVVAYLAPFIVVDYIDRYLLFPLPFLFAACSRVWPVSEIRWRRALALAGIAAAIVLGALATRDYFAWNRARWDAIRLAERLGGNPDTIDGGFEYNGYRRFEASGGGASQGKSWWWVKDDVYVVAFSPVDGYDVVETFNVARVLPRTPTRILLLRRRT